MTDASRCMQMWRRDPALHQLRQVFRFRFGAENGVLTRDGVAHGQEGDARLGGGVTVVRAVSHIEMRSRAVLKRHADEAHAVQMGKAAESPDPWVHAQGPGLEIEHLGRVS